MEVEELLKKLASSNLKQVHRDTKIPYDRMHKWVKGKGNPKKVDFDTLVAYFKSGTSSINKDSSFQESRGCFENKNIGEETKVYNASNPCSDKEKLISALENNLIDKDSIIQKSEQLIKEKERVITMLEERISEYQKKISSPSKEMGNQGSSKPSKRSNT